MTQTNRRPVPYDAVRTRTCEIWFDRMLFGRYLPRAEVTLDDARVNVEVCLHLTSRRAVPTLVDLRDIASQTAEARAHFAGPAAALVASAVAIVVGCAVSREQGDFYLALARPLKPTRVFASEADAAAWLATLLAPAT